MTRLPIVDFLTMEKVLLSLGFQAVRQKGSHAIFHHQDCRRASISIHPAKTISPYPLSDILKRLEIGEDKFLQAMGRR